MAAAMNFAAAERQLHTRGKEYGSQIFAYCNTRNNRVLYSLTRHLNSKTALKQLYDAGANNNPPALRRHDWRPLWTLSLPGTAAGRSLGLAAFERLREWRILHETSWEPPEFFHRKRGEEELKAMEKKLDERGGSKKESVYDVIKHEQHKLRARMVMDQKANSIADLAAVLLWQHDEARLVVDGPSARDIEVAEMLKLADGVENGLLQRLEKQRSLMSQRANFYKQKGASRPEVAQNLAKIGTKYRRAMFAAKALAELDPDRKARLRASLGDEEIEKVVSRSQSKVNSTLNQFEQSVKKQIVWLEEFEKSTEQRLASMAKGAEANELRTLLKNRRVAADAMREVHASVAEVCSASLADHPEALSRFLPLARRKLRDARRADEENRFPTKMLSELEQNSVLFGKHDLYNLLYNSKPASSQTEAASAVESKEIDPKAEASIHSKSEDAPAFASETPAASSSSSTPLTTEFLKANLTSFPPSLDLARQVLREKEAALQGADISWANILDAEYAEAWPETTRHAPMGKTRHAAPKPTDEPLLELPPHPQPNEDGRFSPGAFAKQSDLDEEELLDTTERLPYQPPTWMPDPAHEFMTQTFNRIGRDIRGGKSKTKVRRQSEMGPQVTGGARDWEIPADAAQEVDNTSNRISP